MLNMFPCSPQNNIADSSSGYAKLTRKFSVAVSARLVQVADVNNLFLRKLRTSLALAPRLSIETLSHQIINIVLSCAKKVMGIVTAKFVVATVANIHSVWYRTMRQSISKAVRAGQACAGPKLSITACVRRCSPKPAFCSKYRVNGAVFVDFSPEAISDRRAVRMSMNKVKWFTFCYPAFCSLGKRDGAATATAAKWDEFKFHLSFVRGMILHVIAPFSVDQARVVSATPGVSYWQLLQV